MKSKIHELEEQITDLEETLIDIQMAGRKVVHRKFGQGTILSADEKEDRLYIDFADCGEKKLGLTTVLQNGLIDFVEPEVQEQLEHNGDVNGKLDVLFDEVKALQSELDTI